MSQPGIRVRGIYATALTELLDEVGRVVLATPPIQARFDASFPAAEPTVDVATTDDRLGVGVHGESGAVDAVVDALADVGIDAFHWRETAPLGAVFDAEVTETLGRGAVVDVGPREAFLPFDAADGRVEEGQTRRVQVHEPVPPWADGRPEVGEALVARGALATLVRGRGEPTADVPDPGRATELVRTTTMLPTDVPEGWGVRWERDAAAAGLDALDAALGAAADRVDALTAHLDGEAPPTATTWVQFGRESRFALDAVRRRVVPTMPGHHRVKAGGAGASTAVDLVERLGAHGAIDDAGSGETDGPGDPFPFEAVADTFGPAVGDPLRIVHGKPEGRRFPLGQGVVTDRDGETVTVRREMTAGGEYDALGVTREAGDVAITKLVEGRWWYPTVYRDAEDETKGTYVNVCTPVEVFPTAASYVDLHVDVVKHPDGTVERVDDDELDEAVEAGHVPEPLAEKARQVATAIERALS